MKIAYVGYCSRNHSWSVVSQNISRALIVLGHQVDLYSTNGREHFPEDLKPYLIGSNNEGKELIGRMPDPNQYDACFSYTAMKNFSKYLQYSKKNRFGIWTYEFAGKNALPPGFAKYHSACDFLLAPSNFAKDVFIDSGIPDHKIKIIPHGINLNELEEVKSYPIKSQKSIKILINLGQLHLRKNLSDALEMYGKAFNKNDDVCLILKIADKIPSQQFEISFNQIYSNFIKIHPNHAEIEIIKDYIPNIYSLYKACQIHFSATNCEGFGMPQLESLACGLININPHYGGYLDFLNNDNSLLISGEIFKVPGNYLYYQNRLGLSAFKPNIEDGINKLQIAVKNYDQLIHKIKPYSEHIKHKYNWLEVAKTIINLMN